MALIQCPDCQKDVSSNAATCIHCGRQMKPTNWGLMFYLFVLAFGLCWTVLFLGTPLLIGGVAAIAIGGIGTIYNAVTG